MRYKATIEIPARKIENIKRLLGEPVSADNEIKEPIVFETAFVNDAKAKLFIVPDNCKRSAAFAEMVLFLPDGANRTQVDESGLLFDTWAFETKDTYTVVVKEGA